jgi:hypothetical protein
MSTEPNPDRPIQCTAEDRDWARGVLGVPAGAAPQEAFGIVLARLEEAEFVPPPQWEQAMLLLADEPPRELWLRHQREDMLRPREIALKAEVDCLAEEFFALLPAARHARWRELTEKCAFSVPLSARLEALVDGLDVTPPPIEDDPSLPISRLINDLCRAFVLPPSLRTMRHVKILRRAAADPRLWQTTARDVRDRYPQILPLGSSLIETLADYVSVQKKAVQKHAQQRAALAKAAKQANGISSQRWLLWLLPLAMLFSFIFGLAHNSNSPSNNAKVPRFGSSNPASSFDRDLLRLQKAGKLGILPPRDPLKYSGKSLDEGKFEIGQSFRHLWAIPDNVDIFEENGELVFRRKPNPQPQDSTVPIKPEPPTKDTWYRENQ